VGATRRICASGLLASLLACGELVGIRELAVDEPLLPESSASARDGGAGDPRPEGPPDAPTDAFAPPDFDLTGSWSGSFVSKATPYLSVSGSGELTQNVNEVTGTMTVNFGSCIQNAKVSATIVDGDTLVGTIRSVQIVVSIKALVINPNLIEGTFKNDAGGNCNADEGTFKVSRR
jgi:hypothetical protein